MNFKQISFLIAVLFIAACKKEDNAPVPSGNPLEGSIKIIQESFEGEPIVIVGNPSHNYILGFERTLLDGTLLEFEPKQRNLPAVLQDQEGNVWNTEGKAIEGPRKGENLTPLNSYIGFWFAWGTMYPGIELYDGTPYEGNFQQSPLDTDWNIPLETVFTVLGPDAIPAVDEPVFQTYDEKDFIDNGFFIEDDEMVVGITINNETHIYPISVLNWHEIVNDQIGDTYFSVSFCPLTGTAIAWNRKIDGVVSTFGISGLLYSGNVMPYDRNSNSIWSQMRQDCVNGSLLGTPMKRLPVLETTWATWKNLREAPEVMTFDTGFPKDYSVNPYEGYLQNQAVLSYPVEYHDERLPNKERVFGVIINGKAKAYRFQDFMD